MRATKILHPTDYSEASRSALRTASELAHASGASLVLLHVVETLGLDKLTYGEAVGALQPKAYRERLWLELRQFQPPTPELRVEYVLSEEDVITAVLRTADELGCDLIVLSTHGTNGWQSWFTGSIAESVVRRAPCDVLVVKGHRERGPLAEYHGSEMHPGHLIEKGEARSPSVGS